MRHKIVKSISIFLIFVFLWQNQPSSTYAVENGCLRPLAVGEGESRAGRRGTSVSEGRPLGAGRGAAADEIELEEMRLEAKFAKVREIIWKAFDKLMQDRKGRYLANPSLFLEDLAKECGVQSGVLWLRDDKKIALANKYFNVMYGVGQLSRRVYGELISDAESKNDLEELGIHGPGVYALLTLALVYALREPKGNRMVICAILHEFLELLSFDYDAVDPVFNYVFKHASLKVLEEELQFARELGCLEETIEQYRGMDYEIIKSRYKDVAWKPIFDRYEALLARAKRGELFGDRASAQTQPLPTPKQALAAI